MRLAGVYSACIFVLLIDIGSLNGFDIQLSIKNLRYSIIQKKNLFVLVLPVSINIFFPF